MLSTLSSNCPVYLCLSSAGIIVGLCAIPLGFFVFLSLCVCVSVCHMYERLAEGIESPGDGVKGSCEPPGTNAENWTPFLWKSRKLNHWAITLFSLEQLTLQPKLTSKYCYLPALTSIVCQELPKNELWVQSAMHLTCKCEDLSSDSLYPCFKKSTVNQA